MSRCVSILAASSIASVTDGSPAGKILSSDEDASTKRVSQLLSSKDFRSQLEKLTLNHPVSLTSIHIILSDVLRAIQNLQLALNSFGNLNAGWH